MNARTQQRAAVRVLVALLREDLPVASWTLSDADASLDGQIPIYQGDAENRLTSLQMWAEHLEAELCVTRYEKHNGGRVSVTGWIDGVRVHAWSAFPKKDLPASSAAARPSVRGGPDIGAEAEDGYRAEQDDPS